MSAATVQITDAMAAADLRRAAALQVEAARIVERVIRSSARAADVIADILPERTEDAAAYGLQVCAEELDSPELRRGRSA